MTALREIKLLREVDNPFIVRLLDVFPHKRNLSLVSLKSLVSPMTLPCSIIRSAAYIKVLCRWDAEFEHLSNTTQRS